MRQWICKNCIVKVYSLPFYYYIKRKEKRFLRLGEGYGLCIKN